MGQVTPPIDQLATLGKHQAQFLDTIARADPGTPVPWCGRWRVTHLVTHLARIHHWAAGQARRRQETPLGRGPFELAPLYARCAAELRQTLAELDPEAPAWTLLDDGVPRHARTGTVRFWHRRQAHETLVHLWDLRTAIGDDLDVDARTWHDCVAEVADVLHPRQVRLARVPVADVRVRLLPTDGAAVDLDAAPGTTASASIAAPSRDLALLLWGRAALDAPDGRFVVDGDRSAVERLLAAGLTP